MQVIIIDSWENVNRGVLMFVVRVFYLRNIYLISQLNLQFSTNTNVYVSLLFAWTGTFFFHRGKLQSLTNHSYMLQK